MTVVAYAECFNAEWCNKVHYADCHYAECRYAECRYTECRYTECRCAKCRSSACRGLIIISRGYIILFTIYSCKLLTRS